MRPATDGSGKVTTSVRGKIHTMRETGRTISNEGAEPEYGCGEAGAALTPQEHEDVSTVVKDVTGDVNNASDDQGATTEADDHYESKARGSEAQDDGAATDVKATAEDVEGGGSEANGGKRAAGWKRLCCEATCKETLPDGVRWSSCDDSTRRIERRQRAVKMSTGGRHSLTRQTERRRQKPARTEAASLPRGEKRRRGTGLRAWTLFIGLVSSVGHCCHSCSDSDRRAQPQPPCGNLPADRTPPSAMALPGLDSHLRQDCRPQRGSPSKAGPGHPPQGNERYNPVDWSREGDWSPAHATAGVRTRGTIGWEDGTDV